MSKKETHVFKTEVKQILELIIHSLYSNKEIFLRELISNASDAIDKLRFKSQTNSEILGSDSNFKIKLTVDKNAQTLTIDDNGIGMTEAEVLENIGTIAKSGTKEFLENLKKIKSSENPELIGKFGVGFYSAFMVAEKVTLVTKAAGSENAVKWESTGDGNFTIEETTKSTRGTTITLKLRNVNTSDSDAEKEQDFLDTWTLRTVVKKHSDFVTYPVCLDVEYQEPELDSEGKPQKDKYKKVIKEETLNSMKAIWARDKKDITEEEYKEFYKHVSHDWNDPLFHLHVKLEGKIDYTALLFVPSKAPFDLFYPDKKHGVQLYSKRVFIMDECKELIPNYLRFAKGVVDAPDLNLNVSREILQQDRIVQNIRKNIVKKIIDQLKALDTEKFEKFYMEFGALLKEGVHTDFENRETLADLLRYKSTKSDGKFVTLQDYIAKMHSDQKEIYYITGDNYNALMNSPLLEQLKEKDFEVLIMTDPVDEFVINSLSEYKGKKFKSAEKGDIDINKVDEAQKGAFTKLFDDMKTSLSTKIKEVKASSRMKSSIACLSANEHDMSSYMENLMKATGREVPENKRVLEVNIDHPVIKSLNEMQISGVQSDKLNDYYSLIYDIALISEGGKIENPHKFNTLIGEVMSRGIK